MNKKLQTFSRQLRKNQTDAEKLLWYSLRNRRFFNLKFRRQQIMGKYIVDFICLDPKIIIELDGGQHSTHLSYDQNRTGYLNQRGFKVLRFWNHEVLGNLEGVLNNIGREMGVLSL